MSLTLNPALIEEFTELHSNEGIRDVSHWTLPNDDVPFDEEAALAEFQSNLDGAFSATSTAIKGIVPSSTVTSAKT